MNAALTFRGVAGLIVGATGALFVMNSATNWVITTTNYSERARFLAQIPGVPSPTWANSGGPQALALALLYSIVGVWFMLWGLRQIRRILARLDAPPSDKGSVENRLDELDRLKRREMVTPDEYAAKRTEILKDL